MNKLICIVGMGGAGKSEVAEYMMKKRKFGYVRFGQITLDKVKEMGKRPSEALERQIREDMRKEYGMGAYAILNIPKFDELLKKGDVIGDGLYSWEEYLELRKRYGRALIVIAVFAPPYLRYDRLEGRAERHGKDNDLRYRSFTKDESAKRDEAEIEKLNKAAPISMADYTILNIGSFAQLYKNTDMVLKEIYSRKTMMGGKEEGSGGENRL